MATIPESQHSYGSTSSDLQEALLPQDRSDRGSESSTSGASERLQGTQRSESLPVVSSSQPRVNVNAPPTDDESRRQFGEPDDGDYIEERSDENNLPDEPQEASNGDAPELIPYNAPGVPYLPSTRSRLGRSPSEPPSEPVADDELASEHPISPNGIPLTDSCLSNERFTLRVAATNKSLIHKHMDPYVPSGLNLLKRSNEEIKEGIIEVKKILEPIFQERAGESSRSASMGVNLPDHFFDAPSFQGNVTGTATSSCSSATESESLPAYERHHRRSFPPVIRSAESRAARRSRFVESVAMTPSNAPTPGGNLSLEAFPAADSVEGSSTSGAVVSEPSIVVSEIEDINSSDSSSPTEDDGEATTAGYVVPATQATTHVSGVDDRHGTSLGPPVSNTEGGSSSGDLEVNNEPPVTMAIEHSESEDESPSGQDNEPVFAAFRATLDSPLPSLDELRLKPVSCQTRIPFDFNDEIVRVDPLGQLQYGLLSTMNLDTEDVGVCDGDCRESLYSRSEGSWRDSNSGPSSRTSSIASASPNNTGQSTPTSIVCNHVQSYLPEIHQSSLVSSWMGDVDILDDGLDESSYSASFLDIGVNSERYLDEVRDGPLKFQHTEPLPLYKPSITPPLHVKLEDFRLDPTSPEFCSPPPLTSSEKAHFLYEQWKSEHLQVEEEKLIAFEARLKEVREEFGIFMADVLSSQGGMPYWQGAFVDEDEDWTDDEFFYIEPPPRKPPPKKPAPRPTPRPTPRPRQPAPK